MKFARINGTVIHYQLTGASSAKPVIVFINSLGTDFRIWGAVEQFLADDFAILTYDKRGHGLSELGDAPHRIETHARDLAGLLDHLAISRAVICGLSIGGLIAQCLYALRPDLVSALILCDTAHRIGTADSWNARIAAVETAGIASFADRVMELWFTPDFHSKRPDELAGCRMLLVRQPPEGYAAACAAIRDADFTETARRIAVPTLCVVGDQDGSTPPDLVKSLAKLIPGARFEIIAGAGHIPCIEQPKALSMLIRDFTKTMAGASHG
ncbi:3-oxoadipate enol-lactonase [Taklimakanibacter lacteus]|uniref:3-oxoadipate enol-lactonase n=1 Tax=Taklimakanibacter lacteus TaxID=2268456 RepID=UPI000E665C8F